MEKRGHRFIDMTGQIIENALVLNVNEDYKKENNIHDRAIYWNCQCLLCGNIFIKEGRKLRKTGCKGCAECIKKQQSKRYSNELTGQTFKDIYVIGRDDSYKNLKNFQGNDVIWKCQCLICGNIFHSQARQLRNRIFPGCPKCYNPKKSQGELKIEKILQENNIKYIYNLGYFPDLRGEKNIALRYDFILLDENEKPFRLIEFDGRQHFVNTPYFGGQEGLEKRQYADKLKNIYALQNNYPLIRIHYDEEKNINVENVLLSNDYLVIDENGMRNKDIIAH